jgi:hypothetical protein
MSCSDFFNKCEECQYWSLIEFSQISQLNEESFKNYIFASNRTTHLIIYKLLSSTIRAYSFRDMNVPVNSQIEITFQYNSIIRFDANAMSGLVIKENSTLVLNFPYTTQILFHSKCFDAIRFEHTNSRLVIRIVKAFSVTFINDIISQSYSKTAASNTSKFYDFIQLNQHISRKFNSLLRINKN